jgi:hypothetical protein
MQLRACAALAPSLRFKHQTYDAIVGTAALARAPRDIDLRTIASSRTKRATPDKQTNKAIR